MAAKKTNKPISISEGPGYHNLAERMKNGLIGQNEAVDEICPFLEIYQAGLAMEGRPAAIFMLLGPTGSGKTLSAERLAECLHGSKNNLLRIDCGEFQSDHEVAKLVGAPPGYLGHKETVPLINTQKLLNITSPYSGLGIILFDEIEKAAPALTRMLLGVLDKATLKLGDNSTVNFENTLIMMTSNIGADQLNKESNPSLGFGAFSEPVPVTASRLSAIGTNSAKKRLPPEFMNRIDCVITYKPLSRENIDDILDIELAEVEKHIGKQMPGFHIALTTQAREWIIENGFSKEYGARNLKRLIRKEILFPVAKLINKREIFEGDTARFALKQNTLDLTVA
jgi:hypothetical protein